MIKKILMYVLFYREILYEILYFSIRRRKNEFRSNFMKNTHNT